MAFMGHNSGELLGFALSSGALLLALMVSLTYWRVERKPLHLAYAVATGGWLLNLLGHGADAVFQSDRLAVFLHHAAFQLAIVALLFFFLISATVVSFEIHRVWMAQGVAGLLLLAWNSWGPESLSWVYEFWVVVNIVCGLGLVILGALKAYGPHAPQKRYRLPLATALLGLLVCIADLLSFEWAAQVATVSRDAYAGILAILGLTIFTRLLPWSHASTAEAEAHSTAWAPLTGFGPQIDNVASAIACERRRIAQDLHDGVCSQLVNILASLDARSPQQHGVALAIEHCLVDLKMTVDVMDDTNESVIDALASLRYRVQRGLDALGIDMLWSVNDCETLQNLQGEKAKQVLRVAQECLSNVIRHSQASEVEVICAHIAADNMLLLEIRDNGSGITRPEVDRPGGKGLANMKHRAQKLDASLEISTKAGGGTRVRLLVPIGETSVPADSTARI